jgi:parvulin-like peptidyl-prolyl isomerase
VNNFRRALAAPVVLAALAFGAASCSSVRPAALEVNGHEYSQSSVNDELSAIADNPLLSDQASVSDGTVSAELTASWLQTLVEEQVVAGELARRDLEVTDEDLTAGADAAAAFLGDAQVLDAFPKWFRDRMSRRFAQREVLFSEIGTPVTDADIQAAYDQFMAEQSAQCASGRFAAHILVETQQEAEALANQLASGTSFGELARENSTDTASATNGGELGCVDGQQFVPEFSAVVSSQPLDQVSAPVQTEFGFHLIVVRNVIPLDSIEPIVRAQIELESSGGEEELARLASKAKVDVEPRYGRWVVRDGVGAVLPPKVPAPSASVPASAP